MTTWTIVIPAKGSTGKSRLAHADRSGLAAAIALDTVDAVCRARHVERVVAVTGDERLASVLTRSPGFRAFGGAPVRVVADPGAGLNAAIAAGLASLGTDGPRAALLGDLPALDPSDLDLALDRAAAHPLGLVADAEGTGTTLITAAPGVALEPSFGSGSAARHAAAGFRPLDVPAASTLRRDVDTAPQLRAASAMGLGPRTARLL